MALRIMPHYDVHVVEVDPGAWLHPFDLAGRLPTAAESAIHAAHLTLARRKPSDKIIASGPSIAIGTLCYIRSWSYGLGERYSPYRPSWVAALSSQAVWIRM